MLIKIPNREDNIQIYQGFGAALPDNMIMFFDYFAWSVREASPSEGDRLIWEIFHSTLKRKTN